MTINIPKSKDHFDQQIQDIRQSLHNSLGKNDQNLMNHLPFPEGQIYRRMNANCPVLWVAPHGYFGDAIYSDYIGILAAEMMAASCLVNNKKCRRPLPEPGYGEIADLNDPEDPSAQIFVKKLAAAISMIRLKSGQPPYIVFLLNHNDCDEKSIEITVATSDDLHDMPSSKWIQALKESSASNLFNTNLIEKVTPAYDRTLFSYLFCNQVENGPLRLIQIKLNFQSLSLEQIVCLSGFLSRTVSYSSQANGDLTPIDMNNKHIEPSTEQEIEPDMHLVEEAGLKLTEIVSRHYEHAMIEAGNYIVKLFFNNDIERARNKQATKEKSLHQLILYLQNQKNNAPSKSWLYNAVKLAVDCADFKHYHLYKKLLLSHKIELLPISNQPLKKQLIQETANNNLTVSQLRERISQVKASSNATIPLKPKKIIQKKTSPKQLTPPRLQKKSEKAGENLSKKILSTIDDPKSLLNNDVLEKFSQESLQQITAGKRRQIFRKLEKKHTIILAHIKQLKADIQVNETYLNQYQKLMVEMERSLHESN